MPRLRSLMFAVTVLVFLADGAGAQDRELSQTGLLVGGSAFSISNFDAQLPTASPNGQDLRTSRLTHLMYGVYARFPVNNRLAFEPELLITTKGAMNEERQANSPGSKRQSAGVSLSYFELPLLVRYTVPGNIGGLKPFTVLGPSGGFQQGCKYHAILSDFNGYSGCAGTLPSGEGTNAPYSRWEFSAVAGAGLMGQYRRNKLSAQVRYMQGLNNIVRTVSKPQHTSGFALLFGIEML
jgi:hypothetical protein